ncbi:HIT family protein [Promicromonospora thailandica]|uniref:Histidine triad (HIT) family protein n=1 Tax=Promicromonospora thailandica TaxID=765201 RepID=A0A9X2G157_9MICO|nr:HIT family protein [Promicromonospora thailandica]MCP2263337.1 histidine triad (HIT) family protein [Promicromonospora thailandica]BFF19513.1 HIT family protein [Promicromonospora thailandica]
MTQQPDCLFCGIVAGTVPSTQVDEDERTLTFMDINPGTDGHALVIPKAHARDLYDIDPGDLAACSVTAQRVAGRAVRQLGADGVNLINCAGEAAWQTVFHFHLHVVPRYRDDQARDSLRLPWTPTPGDPARIAAAADLLRAAG